MEPSGRSRNVRVAVRRRSTPAPAAGRAVALFPLRRREIQRLYDTLQVCLARTDAKVLQLIGPRGGEGVSTIAHAFAHVCVTQSESALSSGTRGGYPADTPSKLMAMRASCQPSLPGLRFVARMRTETVTESISGASFT